MRDIKFRAWDSERGLMIGPYGLGDSHWPSNAADVWELMQYTGLKDKNGVEIYERDIVRAGEGQKAYEVFWLTWSGGWHLRQHVLDRWIDVEQFEVMGNIYENPKLLTTKVTEAGSSTPLTNEHSDFSELVHPKTSSRGEK